PLLATTLKFKSSAGYPNALVPYPWAGNPDNPTGIWNVRGSTSTDSTESTQCSASSLPPTTGPVNGVLCLGGTGSVTSIAVPTATVQVPVKCAWLYNPADFFHLLVPR